ncbi:MAG: type III-B CRISPR module RAMP protein Cmr6 [Geminicoccaceae bacterium]|nr:type III-B CRISPR module RAMP protein Cmr6 [Geminicoccaceae bacterium]MDW8126010.1 type III-B CRISPR module RAMP protein Cmr6 [Geminicoccaceae bacterium]
MRRALVRLQAKTCEHPGLAYEVWANFGEADGKIPDSARPGWLSEVAGIRASDDYRKAFERWKASFSQAGDVVVEVEAVSRVLVGHGLGSATDVGLALHRTWGVPVVPGSALKGLLAHYVDAVFGPDPKEPEPERVPFGGVVWEGRRILHGPGEVYRALFGAPEADAEVVGRPNTASRGLVTFHDALWVPNTPGANPLAVDVLTVHQKLYYDSAGDSPPVDWDDPNPVAFLSVRPGARFLLALSGPREWTALAKELLLEALREWGVGGKTAAGYGRLVPFGSVGTGATKEAGKTTIGSSPPPKPGDIVECVLLEQKTSKGGWKARHEPSGIEGPIQNSPAVPAAAKPGDRLKLKVKISKGKESGFEYLSE